MINHVAFQGRLTKDPELKQTQSGVPSLLFTVAWSEKYKEVETTCFLLCRAWRHTAEFIGKYFRKGQEIAIDGHMVTESWGDDKSTTLCVIDKAHFCGSKQERQEKPTPAPSDDFMDIPEGIQDELPFH